MGEDRIRSMQEEDIPAIMQLEEECFPTPWTEDMFICQIMLGDVSANLVYVEDDAITGYVVSWFGVEELHILSIGVKPERRGRNIAENLLNEAIRRSMKNRCKKVILEVRRSNSRARKFYQKLGFRHIGIRKKYYSENGEDALVLEKDIEIST